MIARLFAALLLVLSGPLAAQTLSTTGAGTPPKPSYTGPGNIVSGATAFYSLRAYTAAIAAAATQTIVDLRRPADNATCTPKIASNGSVDLTVGTVCNSNTQTVTNWLGSAATCTGAIGPASTTITITSCSVGSLTVGALITGTGVSASTYVTAVVGGCTAVSSCTVSVSQTAASTTLTAAPSVPLVSKWYDQSGNTRDASQGTAANQPQLVLSGGPNNLPYISFSGSQWLRATTVPALTQPFSESVVFVTDGSVISGRIVAGGGTNVGLLMTTGSGANSIVQYSGTGATVAATINVWHAGEAVFNGASSSVAVDGSVTATNPGTGNTSTGFDLGSQGGSNAFKGGLVEVSPYPIGFSAGNITALTANQKAYYGTP